jgi:8-oxo-dGTP pyrophosphatase MutT (NUDIX family)/ribosomal protein S18 acetylase RimI-like enzyme
MRFELVAQRLAALPRELPAPPAILTPIRVDRPEDLTAIRPAARIRQAAVLILLFPDTMSEAHVLLTVRVPTLAEHAGEISFPGGSAGPHDRDPVATALREAQEEVDLDPGACGLRVAGALERFTIPVSGFQVTPVVATAQRRPICRANPDEVERILEAPVEAFLPDAPVELEERVIRERLVRFGVYPVGGERVWGATARMLGQLGAVLATEPAPVEGGAGRPPERPPDRAAERAEGPIVRRAGPPDGKLIDAFVRELAPELARQLPPASDTLIAEVQGSIAGLASWAPWERPRPKDQPQGFEGLTLPEKDRAAELTLLAVAPAHRQRGIGRELTDAIAEVARSASCTCLLAWTLSDTAIHPSSVAARAFFRSTGFVDLAVDRRYPAGAEDRLLLMRPLR